MKTTKGMRVHIGIFGKRNVGKSSIMNALTEQDISIVSDTAGTTTDAVEKSYELLPMGPVTFIDTAGIDDEGCLGSQRVEKTRKVIDRTDLALIVVENSFDDFEKSLIKEFEEHKTPYIFVFNKCDIIENEQLSDEIKEYGKDTVKISALKKIGIEDLKSLIIKNSPDKFFTQVKIAGDLLNKGDTAILVIPVDKEAPAGRLILPEVQTIRDLLDSDNLSYVVKETDLKQALDNLKTPPKLVITDSQAFKTVAETVPDDIMLTSFSILFARLKGDLAQYVEGTMAIKSLKDGDNILFCESCTHHNIGDDIARVKIPKILSQKTGKKLNFEYLTGHDFAADLSKYSLIIHCGACMTNRKEVLSRQMKAKNANIPMTNYGLTIAFCTGILERALLPFKDAKEIFQKY